MAISELESQMNTPLSISVLFATREKELVKEMEKGPFDVEIIFLEDANQL